jgi:hypothetical protein
MSPASASHTIRFPGSVFGSVAVELMAIVSPGLDVANTILSHAADVGTEFIVMGGCRIDGRGIRASTRDRCL